jgi:uncharacterized protein DUF5677
MSLEATIADIERVEVSEDAASLFVREGQYLELAFNLLRETGQWVCVASCLSVGDRPIWNVRQAVIGGHLVRLFKLIRLLLETVNTDRAELMWVLLRLASECVINLRYLLLDNSDEVVQSYLHQSLQHERELKHVIERNIAARNGERLPIEDRMLGSIAKAFEKSQVREDDLPVPRIRHWGGKNAFEKAEAIGLEDAYLAVFGGPSRNIHGGWRDLLEHHLVCEAPGQFAPNLEFSSVRRPQPIFATASMIVPGLIDYVDHLAVGQLAIVREKLLDLYGRILLADRLHEAYLQGCNREHR